MFEKIINRIQNPKHFLFIIIVLSTVFSAGHLNLIGFGFSILGLLGLKNTELSYLKVYTAYIIIEIILYSICEIFFVGILFYDIYLIFNEKSFDDKDSEEIEIIFGFSFLYSIVIVFLMAIAFKIFTFELLKNYVSETEPIREFHSLESGNNIVYNENNDNNNTKNIEKLDKNEKIYIDRSNIDYNDYLPQYNDYV